MRDRPVVNASRTLGALSLLAGAIPILGASFNWFSWTIDQLEAYTVAVGIVISALALFLGVSVEKVVTPMNNPKDDAGNSLTPGPIGQTEI